MNYENEELWQAMKSSKYRNTIDSVLMDINKADDIDEVLSKILNVVVEAVHAEAGTLWIYDYYKTGRIIPKANYGGVDMKGFSLKLDEGMAGSVIKNGIPKLISNCESEPNWAERIDEKTGFKTKSMICVPLIAKDADKAFGCIQIINKTDGSLYDEKDLDFVLELANEFNEAFVLKTNERVFGASIKTFLNIDNALYQNSEEEMLKILNEAFLNSDLSENKIKDIREYVIKIYRAINSK